LLQVTAAALEKCTLVNPATLEFDVAKIFVLVQEELIAARARVMLRGFINPIRTPSA